MEFAEELIKEMESNWHEAMDYSVFSQELVNDLCESYEDEIGNKVEKIMVSYTMYKKLSDDKYFVQFQQELTEMEYLIRKKLN